MGRKELIVIMENGEVWTRYSLSVNLRSWVTDCRINDAPFLLEEDTKYGGVKPRRNYNGMRFNNGFSDHLPLVLRLQY